MGNPVSVLVWLDVGFRHSPCKGGYVGSIPATSTRLTDISSIYFLLIINSRFDSLMKN